MIRQGRITVNGITASIGQSACIDTDSIAIDGVELKPRDEHIYVMLNKPRGYLTTVKDDRGRRTVMHLTEELGVRVYPIGRLDMDSEGLLLMTNDGDFANTVMHPRFDHLKTYEVVVNCNGFIDYEKNRTVYDASTDTGSQRFSHNNTGSSIPQGKPTAVKDPTDCTAALTVAVELLKRPMLISGAEIQAVEVKIIKPLKQEASKEAFKEDSKEASKEASKVAFKEAFEEALISITIREGRNRQIRKMCALCGLRIKSLRRVSIGDLTLGELAPGQWRHLTEDERKKLLT